MPGRRAAAREPGHPARGAGRAWRQLYAEANSRGTALWIVNTTPLDTSPGKRYVYSDLGAIVLTEVVERIAGEPLDAFLDARVFRPLGMPATRFLPPQSWRDP